MSLYSTSTTTPSSTTTTLSIQTPTQNTAIQNKETEFYVTLDRIRKLTLTPEGAKNPFHFQTIALLYFNNDCPNLALEATTKAKALAKQEKINPKTLYVLLLREAKYLSASENLEDLTTAQQDLSMISDYETPFLDAKRDDINKLSKYVNEKIWKCKQPIRDIEVKSEIRMPKIGSTYYKDNLKRYINNIKENCPVPIGLRYIEQQQSQQIYINALDIVGGMSENLENIVESIQYAENKLNEGQAEREWVNDHSTDAHWKNRLVNHLQTLNGIILRGQAKKSTCAECYYYKGYIYIIFKKYMYALVEFARAVQVDARSRYTNEIADLSYKLSLMEPEERLEWIDIALHDMENDQNGKTDKDLLFWKTEAHFELDQVREGSETAQKLLLLITDEDPIYKIVLQMATSHTNFKFSDK